MPQEMSFQPTDPFYEQRVRASFARQPFMEFLGAQLLTVRPGRCEIALSYREELSQQHGFFHAGIIGTIADNAAGYAAYSLCWLLRISVPKKRFNHGSTVPFLRINIPDWQERDFLLDGLFPNLGRIS